MNTRRLWLGMFLVLCACAPATQAPDNQTPDNQAQTSTIPLELADRAYSMTRGPDCVGIGEAGCEVFPVAMRVKGAAPLALHENHDSSAPVIARIPPDQQATKTDNVWLNFYTHGGVVLKAGAGLAIGDRVYPSTRFEADSYPFADWDDPDDDSYDVQVVPTVPEMFGINVYFKKPEAPQIEWKKLQPAPTTEHWMQLQLADGTKGWIGPCTYDKGFTCEGSPVDYVRREDTREGRLARVEAWLAENPDYGDYEGDGDIGLPPPEYQPGDPQMLHVLRGGNIQFAAFSPDSRQVVTASVDGVIRLWNTADGKEAASFPAPGDASTSASFSPDGKHIVTANGDGTTAIWTSAGRLVRSMPGHVGGAYSAEYSPDGARILTTGADNIARIWDAATGQQVRALTSTAGSINFATFMPDGARVVTGSHDTYASEVWNVASGALLQTLQTGGLGSGVAFSPDGRQIASIGWDIVTVHDVASGKEAFQFGIFTKHVALSSIAYAPDGKRIITGEEMGYARVWDAKDGKLLFGLNPYDPKSPLSRRGPAKPIQTVAISPDGSRILTVGRGAAHIWGVN